VLGPEGRGFAFTVSKILEFRGSFSATVVINGQTQTLLSATGRLVGPAVQSHEETPCGRASVTEVTLCFEQERMDLLFRLSQVPGIPGFQAKAAIRNRGSIPVRLLSVTPLALEGRLGGKPDCWLVTSLNTSVKDAPAVMALDELTQPFSVFEYGGLYSAPEGSGFLFGPVGTPTAYVQASIVHKGECHVSFSYTAEMSGVQVDPGETRWGQQVGLFTESPGKALASWTDWVARTHNARTDKGALSGWNSYSFHASKITGQDVLADVETVVKNPERFRPQVMQIDTGFEKFNKLRSESSKFPEGMPFYAKRISETGARPGILLNFQGPPGFETTAGRMRERVRDGFTYLKINRTFLTLEEEEVPRKTSFEALREGFKKLREAAGEETYLLYNEGRPNRATVGLMDANRTGTFASRSSVRNAMTDVLRSYQLNNRWFAVDNDAYFMGTDIANVSEINGGWPIVRTWMSMVGLSCGASLTSDPWHWESFQRYWRNVEVMTPPAREETRVLDLCTSRNWTRLLGHVKRPWGEQVVALLWNAETSERNITLDFKRAGMNLKHRYAVWSFWDNRYLGVANGSWATPSLGASASQHICFTDLDLTRNKPVLIGSSLHIYCGAAEISRVSTPRGAMEIELTDAGAREGDLFIYSRNQPIWKAAEGCMVTEIASAGENVWRVHLLDRVSDGSPQRVTLGILLPVTQQIWFWVLCSILIASLLFAVWRYLAFSRLREQHTLEQERGRIARDIHDGLGVSLTQIAMRCEVMGVEQEIPSQLRGHVDEISRNAHALARAADEIVWAVTPANDTAEKFVSFVGHFVETTLSAAGLSCRLDLPSDALDLPMSATVRHHLLLVLKEALNNAIRHAAAHTVSFSLVLKGREMTITVADDGRGFNTDAPSKPLAERVLGGNGLPNMRKRIAEIGGTLGITSAPGSGTTLTLRIQL